MTIDLIEKDDDQLLKKLNGVEIKNDFILNNIKDEF